VLLGGVDFNPVTRHVMEEIGLQLRQDPRETVEDPGAFVVTTPDGEVRYKPKIRTDGDVRTLKEDVAHFYRGPNPYNKRRTVTICNGMYGRGTEGAAKATTDPLFRDRNYQYAQEHLTEDGAFSLLFRVRISPGGKVLPPDWTQDETRLHEWTTGID